MKSRFLRDLNGDFGEFWKREAEKQIESVRTDLEDGKITIDEHGVARNHIGRVLMSDLAEVLSMVTSKIDLEATAAACDEEARRAIADYRATKRPPTAEELAEMRSTFGPGETVVDILSGDTIKL